jgi:hypothetical protein
VRDWLRVYTYKTGLLSPVAHDLQLSLEHWELRREDAELVFLARLESLRVEGPVVRGKLDPRGISDRDRTKIKGHIGDTVLHTAEHPVAIFKGQQEGSILRGPLRLRGQAHEISFALREVGGQIKGEVEIQPSRWGIAPFKALGGAIKLKDQVRIAFAMHVL